MKHTLLPAAFLVLAALAACAPSRGAWPSLARVPGSPAVPCGAAAGAGAESPVVPGKARPCVGAPPTPTPGPAASPVTVDIAALEQRFAAARQAWTDQLEKTEAAAHAARSNAGETAWAGAELELSRLEQRAAPFAQIAETLADAEPSARITALREAAVAARDEHLRAFGRLRATLQR